MCAGAGSARRGAFRCTRGSASTRASPIPDQREVGGHGPFNEGGGDGRALRYPGGGQPADQPDLDDADPTGTAPRTASLIHAMAKNYCDMIHDLAEDTQSAIPLKPHDDLWRGFHR
jgi:hypothetical protein